MTYYVEWAPALTARFGAMIPTEDLASQVGGWRTVYEFSELTAKEIIASGSSKGYDKFPVYSDTLFIDMDLGETGVHELTQKLNYLGFGFQVYSSGGKGFHFHIPCVPMEGYDVPYSQYAFAKTELTDHLDASLYRPGSLIALPGRVHIKTGALKTLVGDYCGMRLVEIPMRATPRIQRSEVPIQPHSPAAWQFALQKAAKFIQSPPGNGFRHTRLWSLAETMCDAGLSYDCAAEICLRLGSFVGKEDDDVIGIIDRAYEDKVA